MKKCPLCGQAEFSRTSVSDVVQVGSIRFELYVEGAACPCGETFLDGMDIASAEKKVARWLAAHGVATPEAFRYMRRALGICSMDLADMFGVMPETISHWEDGKHEVPRNAIALLAGIVMDDACGRTDTVDRLRKLGGPGVAPCTVTTFGST